MKYAFVFVLAASLLSCTKERIFRPIEVEANKISRGIKSAEKDWRECEHLRDTIISMIEARVPEINSNLLPFARSYAKREDIFLFGGLRCSDSLARDTNLHGFYSISVGFGDGTDEHFTVETFYITEDLKSIYVRGPNRGTKVLLEEARQNPGWKEKWH